MNFDFMILDTATSNPYEPVNLIKSPGFYNLVFQDVDGTFWYWKIPVDDWNSYFERQLNPKAIFSPSKKNAIDFFNDDENSNIGFSHGNYFSVLDIINEIG